VVIGDLYTVACMQAHSRERERERECVCVCVCVSKWKAVYSDGEAAAATVCCVHALTACFDSDYNSHARALRSMGDSLTVLFSICERSLDWGPRDNSRVRRDGCR
jgi:hypothetical protein